MIVTEYYRRTLKPAKESEDGESPTTIRVIHSEIGTYTLVFSDFEKEAVLAQGYNRDALIELAVNAKASDLESCAKVIANTQKTLEALTYAE